MKLVRCMDMGLFHQIFAGVSVSMGVFASSALFAWVTPILPQLLSSESEIPMTAQDASWMISFPEFANLVTPIPAGLLADRIGRKPMILFSAPLFTIGWAIILYYKTYFSLLFARSIQGAAVGVVYTAVPVYLGEIASTESRGAISSLFFIISWTGYLFEYCTGALLSFNNFTLVTLVMTVVYFVMVLFQPESPYFYLMKGDYQEAFKSLQWFRGSVSEDEVRQELETMIQSVEEDRGRKTTWKEVISTPTDRKALYLILFAASLRILSGMTALVAYATQNFRITPDLIIPPKYITIFLGLVLVFSAVCSFFTLDWFGRRSLLISSALGSSVTLFIAGMYYYLDSNTQVDVSSYSYVAPIVTLVYGSIAVAGLYPVSTAYTAELFKSNTRSTAAGISAVVTTFLTFVVLKSYQTFIDIFGVYFNFFMFSTICFVGAVLSYIFMPETKHKTFEQIRKDLHVSGKYL